MFSKGGTPPSFGARPSPITSPMIAFTQTVTKGCGLALRHHTMGRFHHPTSGPRQPLPVSHGLYGLSVTEFESQLLLSCPIDSIPRSPKLIPWMPPKTVQEAACPHLRKAPPPEPSGVQTVSFSGNSATPMSLVVLLFALWRPTTRLPN